MNRRKFVTLGATSVCLLPLAATAGFIPVKQKVAEVKPDWLVKLIKINDTDLNGMMAHRITDPSHRYFGGFMSDVEIPNPHSTCAYINRACAAVTCPESAYYQSQQVLNNTKHAATKPAKNAACGWHHRFAGNQFSFAARYGFYGKTAGSVIQPFATIRYTRI